MAFARNLLIFLTLMLPTTLFAQEPLSVEPLSVAPLSVAPLSVEPLSVAPTSVEPTSVANAAPAVGAVPFAVEAEEPLTELEQRMLDQAINHCLHWGKGDIGEERKAMLRTMLLIERKFEFPDEARGMTLAAACRESAYRTKVKGDCNMHFAGKHKGKRVCHSWGLMQWANWAIKHIREAQEIVGSLIEPHEDPRFDWYASTHYWAQHFMKKLKWVQRSCRFTPTHWTKTYRRRMFGSRMQLVVAAADATAVRSTYCVKHEIRDGLIYCIDKRPRCFETTKHYTELRRWQTDSEALPALKPPPTGSGLPSHIDKESIESDSIDGDRIVESDSDSAVNSSDSIDGDIPSSGLIP